MDSFAGNYLYLISKIDEFIRKYYLNKVIKGVIYLSSTLFASYILVTGAEYFGNFNEVIRSVLFYSFLLLNIFILLRSVLLPLSSYYKLGSTISHEHAAEIIGKHFAHIQDKLLNTLQLKKLADENPEQRALIEAGVNQKIGELSPIPFTSAIKISRNRKYLRYALPPLFIIIMISITAPVIFSEGTERILHYNKKYVKKAPFKFIILNRNLSVIQGDDLELRVKLEGNEIPQDIWVQDGANTFKLDKENIIRFNYTFRNLQHHRKIRLTAGGFYSDLFLIDVKKRPSLLNSDVHLEYPSYLNKNSETINNAGDLTVPEGTKISWKFRTGNTRTLSLRINNKNVIIRPSGPDSFSYSVKALRSSQLRIQPVNTEVTAPDYISYQLTVIPDLAPSIDVAEHPDSLNRKILYFTGRLNDDHGFSTLKFHYKITGDKTTGSYNSRTLSFDRNAIQSSFFYAWNINSTGVKPGSKIEYFFEVFDNDGVNGPKPARSEVRTFRIATEKETEKKVELASESVKQKMQQAARQAEQLGKEARRVNQDLLNKKNLSFEEKKEVEELLDKHEKLGNLIEEIRRENRQKLNDQNDLSGQNREIIEKQKQIDDLFNNVLDEKTKEILRNIESLLEQNNKNQTQQELSKMQMDSKSLQKELDRILELYKQLGFDQKLAGSIEDLNKLAEKQQDLSTKTQQKTTGPEDLLKQEQTVRDEFKEIRKALSDLEKKNEELERKNNFENPETDQQQIEQQLQESSKNLRNKNPEKAAGNMQKAASEMKNLSKKLGEMQQESEMEENKVNIQDLRGILANLLTSSFSQEQVMLDLRNTSLNDPAYVKLTQKQKDIRDNLKMVEDSLYSLSRKVPQIQSVVNKEIQAVNDNIDQALDNLAERRTAEANRDQQYAMTSINNLALMLSEVEEQLQKAMQKAQGGKGKQKSLSQLSKMQEELNRNMQKARDQMRQQGIQQEQAQGKGNMSEQMAKMARQQQLIRQALQSINQDMSREGKGRLENLDKLSKEMEQTETDLVNKKIRQETLLRQQEILTKLLETEKAEREQEFDSQRESKEGRDQSPSLNKMLENFKKTKKQETELIKTVPASLSLFYQLKVGEYFRHLDTK